jgi:hypothetical protein
VEFFNIVVDTALTQLQERFHQYENHAQVFGFLYSFRHLERSDLVEHCGNLSAALSGGDSCDIDGHIMTDELQYLQTTLAVSVNRSGDILKFLHTHDFSDIYPVTVVALVIFLTIPVTVASGERSFFKLNLINTFLRSTMLHERLSSLAIISIENEILKEVDMLSIIKAFSTAKSRKVTFI